MILSLWLAALPCLFWTQGVETAASLKSAGIERLCVPGDQAEAWRSAGLEVSPMSETDLALREILPAPGIRPRAGRASPTRTPWIDASGWRFLRDRAGLFSYELPAGKAALAAAEAYAYAANVLMKIDPADVPSLGAMITFLSQLPTRELPDVADLAVVDDSSAVLGEVLNLLVRRNLLFRIVKEPTSELPVNVKVGTKEYPQALAGDPSAFALAVRRHLGDERRTLRIFGSEVVIGRLAADADHLRLHLLNYGGRELEGLRIRVRGSRPTGVVTAAGHGRVALEDHAVIDGGTEFTVPRLGPYGVVDLPAVR